MLNQAQKIARICCEWVFDLFIWFNRSSIEDFDCHFLSLLLKVVFRLAKSGRKVLFISAKSPESLPMDDEYDDAIYRDVLRNTTFSYSSDPMKLIDFILDMRVNVQPRPDCIVIDFLHTFFDYFLELDVDLSLHTHFMECHMLMTATLLSTIDMFCNDDNASSNSKFMSIICIDPQCHTIYNQFIQTYIDLYYYEAGSILSFNELMEKFPYQSWFHHENKTLQTQGLENEYLINTNCSNVMKKNIV